MSKAGRAAVVVFAVLASGAGSAVAHAAPARLQGRFSMRGTLTTADDVFGERPGERVARTWDFVPQCASGTCRRILLRRRRSGRHILDVVMLARQPSGVYVGQGSFWIPLSCAGLLDDRGGLATETITVRITRTQLVGTTPFATAIDATYTNPSRQNLTRCPGELGHDGAHYTGHLTTHLTGPPEGTT